MTQCIDGFKPQQLDLLMYMRLPALDDCAGSGCGGYSTSDQDVIWVAICNPGGGRSQ